MKIIVKKCNLGTEVSIYIPSSELTHTDHSYLTDDFAKDYRVKRTLKKSLSEKSREALRLIIVELLSNFNTYKESYERMGYDYILEKIQKKFQNTFNEYQYAKIQELLEDIALPLVFKKDTKFDIETIRSRYDLDSRFDLLISVIGNFGYGKTTLIKKILGFDDSYKFLLVDNGRTTIYNTIIKGLITISEGENTYILKRSKDSEELCSIPLEEYEFKNQITLHSYKYVYENIISQSVNKAFEVFCKNPDDKLATIKEFVKNSKCNLDGLFGKVEKETIEQDSIFYGKLLDEFSKEFNKIELEHDYDVDFCQNSVLLESFENLYTNSINDAIKEKKINYFPQEGKIEFSLKSTEIDDCIDTFYRRFTDNSIKGGALRILVKEIYVETNLDVRSFVDNNGDLVIPAMLYEDESEEKTIKFHSIVFTDTIGCAHEQESVIKSENRMDGDIVANTKLLNESDLIILLEKASETMKADIKKQLYTLESLGLNSKVVMCYSYYNQFIKSDIASDEERENELNKHFKSSLLSLYSDNKVKAENFYNSYTSGIGKYETNRQIVYLKGLVKRKDISQKSLQTKTNNRRSSVDKNNKLDEKVNQENQIAEVLNKDCDDCNNCLSELIDKIVLLVEEMEKTKELTVSIKNKSIEEVFAVRYYRDIYPKYLSDYLAYQKEIYQRIIPWRNTTKALCYNAIYGNPEFYGTSITLRPLNDAISLMSEQISTFLDEVPPAEIQTDDDGESRDKALTIDFLTDQIKSNFSAKLNEVFNFAISVERKKEWTSLYNDCGTGDGRRRSFGIYNLLEQIYTMKTIEAKVLEKLRDSVSETIESYNNQG